MNVCIYCGANESNILDDIDGYYCIACKSITEKIDDKLYNEFYEFNKLIKEINHERNHY